MKNTLENKAKFFAQYWGQDLLRFPSTQKEISCTADVNTNAFLLGHVEYSWLELKPLYQITDEDAIEVCQRGYPLAFEGSNPISKWAVSRANGFISIKTKYSHFSFEFDTEGTPYVDMYDDDELCNTFSNESVIDALRLKGFAVDWNGISVEQQIEYGWIKLKL